MAGHTPGKITDMLGRHRVSSVARLCATTNRQLAVLGSRRADIPAFVFEDLSTG